MNPMSEQSPKREALERLSREELYELLDIYSKNWLALDGVWFQSVERELGMDQAMHHDAAAWSRFTEIEAARIKAFLRLPQRAGLEGPRAGALPPLLRQSQPGRDPSHRQHPSLPHSGLPGPDRPPAQGDAAPPLQAGRAP